MAISGSTKKKKIIIFSILGVLLLAIVIAVIAGSGKDEIITVQTETVLRKTITQVVEATGRIQPQTQVKINAEVSGEIIDLPIEEGVRVKRGQLLVRIKPDTYIAQRDQSLAMLNRSRAQLVQAQADFRKIESEHRRQQEMFSKGLISESELEAVRSAYEISKAMVEAARADVQNSEANVQRAREELNKTSIYSPIDGVVTQLLSKVGERVSGSSFMQGTEIMTISDLSVMEARVDVNENDVILISPNDTARVEVDAYPDRSFLATVYQIANTATTRGMGTQEEVTNFEVKLVIDTEGVDFRPGMSATARIQTETRSDVLTVPLQSVTTREEVKRDALKDEDFGGVEIEGLTDRRDTRTARPQEVVFVVKDGMARKMPVKTGISSDARIEIREGLEEGMEVVSGSYRAISRELDDSTRIRVDNKNLVGRAGALERE